MLQKSLLVLALAAACVSAQAQSTPAKKELVARILKVQQPAFEMMARGLVEEPAVALLDRAGTALNQRVAADKREAVGKEIQADVRKYVDETVPIVRDRAIKLAPSTVGTLLEEKFTEDELKQIVGMLESPLLAKYQQLGADMQKALIEKVVADARPQVEPKVQALEATISKRLGITPGAGNAPAAPAADKKAPAKK
jgi:hypothetical protein